MKLITFLFSFLFSLQCISGVEFHPRSQRYLYDREDLMTKLVFNGDIPTNSEYTQMRDLLDEELQSKFPTYEQYVKNLLNEHATKIILTKSLDLLAKNHRLKSQDISSISVQAFNLVNAYLGIDISLSFEKRMNLLEKKLKDNSGLSFRFNGFPFGSLNMKLFSVKKSLALFLSVNNLENKFIFDSENAKRIEKIFTFNTEMEVESYLKFLIEKKYIILTLSKDNFTEYLISRVLQFSYDLIIEQIDDAVMVHVKKQKRRELIDSYLMRVSSKYPFYSLFIDQAHLDLVEKYLQSLPDSPLLKPNLRASGFTMKCHGNCNNLVEGYKKQGSEFLDTLSVLEKFTFDKYPKNEISKKLSPIFFNPLNDMLGIKVAGTFNGKVYFLVEVETIDSYDASGESGHYRDLIQNEYQKQRLNNLLYFSMSEIFYQMNFSHIVPLCHENICSDLLRSTDIEKIIFHQINTGNEFKILKPKQFLNEVF